MATISPALPNQGLPLTASGDRRAMTSSGATRSYCTAVCRTRAKSRQGFGSVSSAATCAARREQLVDSHAPSSSGGGAQAVTVLDENRALLMDLPHGGFITVIQNGVQRARLTARVDQSLPVRIVEYANGRLTVVDDHTGWSAELGAFGSDNKAAFERLMSQ